MQTNYKTIFITGCDSGFGRATALALADRGHYVIATTEKLESALDLNNLAKGKNLKIEAFKLDVTIPADREKILNYEIDVLLNNAGTGESGSLAEIPLERLRHDFEVNVFGSLALSQLAFKKMFARGQGRILFVSSLAGRRTMPFLGSYSMTKFALCGGVEALRQEIKLVAKDIQVALIEPGAYHTGFNQRNIAKKYEWMDKQSYFFALIDKLKIQEANFFSLMEVKSLESMVRQMVRACETGKLKLRYSAPWWQNLGVQILRLLGK